MYNLNHWASSTNHPRFLRIYRYISTFLLIRLLTILLVLICLELFTFPTKYGTAEGTRIIRLRILLIILCYILILLAEIVDYCNVKEMNYIIILWNLNNTKQLGAKSIKNGILLYRTSKYLSLIPGIGFLGMFFGNCGIFLLSDGLTTFFDPDDRDFLVDSKKTTQIEPENEPQKNDTTIISCSSDSRTVQNNSMEHIRFCPYCGEKVSELNYSNFCGICGSSLKF
jgi:hypothetical protein